MTTIGPDTRHHDRLFPRLTAEQQERIAQYGMGVVLNPGDLLFAEGEPVDGIFIVTEGEVKVTRQVAGGTTVLTVHTAGEFTGELSTLAGGNNIATGRAVGLTHLIRLSHSAFKRLLTEQIDIRDILVPAIASRRPEAERMIQEREKLAALGRLSAGLAHEVNNPAAAARSAAEELGRTLDGLLEVTLRVGRHGLSPEQAEAVARFQRTARGEIADLHTLDPLERGDRENQIIDWLDARGVEEPWDLGPCLLEAGANLELLENLTDDLPDSETLRDALNYVVAMSDAQTLIDQITEATGRIVDLVKTVKRYSYRDQAPRQEVDLNAGLQTTLDLFSRLNKEGIIIELDLSNACPPISAFGSELNQVWTNLLVNAADAIRERQEKEGDTAPTGVIRVQSRCEFNHVLVRIEDNGTGIAPEIQPHLFEPFFSTKGPGKGTGLGLDIVHQIIVGRHRGDIQVESEPGRTRFTVRIPTNLVPDEAPANTSNPQETPVS